jgi:lipopolysaccharide transport system ATP-binding protein
MSLAIQLFGVSKCYKISYDKPALVRQILPRFIRPRSEVEHWALHPIDLSLEQGQSLGIIGLNGAGKTTLLSIMAGITHPTTGSVWVRGRRASLMSLGGGFHPELTGRENIFLNGTLLGMTTQEIRARLDSIIRFTQLERFIDAPLSTYSAGMQLRLGFAIAMHHQNDVLMMDEVLAVGDIAFEKRCLKELDRFREEGKTLIFSTQNLSLMERLCDRVLLLHRGMQAEYGSPARVLQAYRQLSNQTKGGQLGWLPEEKRHFVKRLALHKTERLNGWGQRFERPELRILKLRFLDKGNQEITRAISGELLKIELSFECCQEIQDPHFGMALFRSDQVYVFGPNSRFDHYQIERIAPGKGRCTITFDALSVSEGEYRVSAAIWERHERFYYAYDCAYYALQVKGHSADVSGVCAVPGEWKAERPATLSKMRGGSFLQKKYLDQLPGLDQPNHVKMSEVMDVSADILRTSLSLYQSSFLHWGQPVEFALSITSPHSISKHHIWLGVVRDPDGLLCSGWSTWQKGIELSCPQEIVRVKLSISKWPLTAGRYRLACAVWNDQGVIVYYNFQLVYLYVVPGRPDHGVTYFPHKWQIQLPN